MRYLVTGGAGFIGSNLVEELLKKRQKVIVVDNLSTGSLDNLSKFKARVNLFICPVAKVLEIKEIKNLDGIFHLGIPSSTGLYRANHFLVGEAVNEFMRVLELAKREKCKLVYASSSSVYNGNKIPFKETMLILVKDFYTEARYLMERLARLYFDFYGVKSMGFRFFSVYGPREEAKKDFANLISQFLWKMKKGEKPVIYGNGKQSRDFIYVGDAVRGLLMGMRTKINCDVFNLGTGKAYELNEVAALLNEFLGKKISPIYIKKNPIKNYVEKTLADTKKAELKLGFKAEISLRGGLKKLVGA